MEHMSVGYRVILIIIFSIISLEHLIYLILIIWKPNPVKRIGTPINFFIYMLGVEIGCSSDIAMITSAPCYLKYTLLMVGLLLMGTYYYLLYSGFFLISYDIYRKYIKKQILKHNTKTSLKLFLVIIVLYGIYLF